MFESCMTVAVCPHVPPLVQPELLPHQYSDRHLHLLNCYAHQRVFMFNPLWPPTYQKLFRTMSSSNEPRFCHLNFPSTDIIFAAATSTMPQVSIQQPTRQSLCQQLKGFKAPLRRKKLPRSWNFWVSLQKTGGVWFYRGWEIPPYMKVLMRKYGNI